jgi:hypothetical protein
MSISAMTLWLTFVACTGHAISRTSMDDVTT